MTPLQINAAWMEPNFDNRFSNWGKRGSRIAQGPGWAQASPTPFHLFKNMLAEGGIRLPLIISGPGVAYQGGVWIASRMSWIWRPLSWNLPEQNIQPHTMADQANNRAESRYYRCCTKKAQPFLDQLMQLVVITITPKPSALVITKRPGPVSPLARVNGRFSI